MCYILVGSCIALPLFCPFHQKKGLPTAPITSNSNPLSSGINYWSPQFEAFHPTRPLPQLPAPSPGPRGLIFSPTRHFLEPGLRSQHGCKLRGVQDDKEEEDGRDRQTLSSRAWPLLLFHGGPRQRRAVAGRPCRRRRFASCKQCC